MQKERKKNHCPTKPKYCLVKSLLPYQNNEISYPLRFSFPFFFFWVSMSVQTNLCRLRLLSLDINTINIAVIQLFKTLHSIVSLAFETTSLHGSHTPSVVSIVSNSYKIHLSRKNTSIKKSRGSTSFTSVSLV